MGDNNTLESLEIEVKQQGTESKNEVDKLTASLKELKAVCQGGAGLGEVVKQLSHLNSIFKNGGLGTAAKKVSEVTKAVGAAAGKTAAIKKPWTYLDSNTGERFDVDTEGNMTPVAAGMGKEAEQAAEATGQAAEATRRAAQAATAARESYAQWAEESRELQKTIDAITDAMQGGKTKQDPGVSAADQDQAQELIEHADAASLLRMRIDAATQKLAEMVASSKNNGEQIAATTAKIQRMKDELAALGVVEESTGRKTLKLSGGFGKLLKSVGRVAFYRVIRTVLSSITGAMSDGLKNVYAFSAGINGPLAASLDGLSTKSMTMKNQLGSAFGSLLVSVIPILQTLISWVTAAANALAQLFSFLGGSGTQLKAKDSATAFQEIGGGAGGAAESVKELRRQLMGFDEINRLEAPDTGGGGGGAGGANIGDMFEEVAIDEKWRSLGDKLKPIIEGIKLIFQGLVDFIAGAFTGDWDRAFQGLANITRGFADTVNGAVDMLVWMLDGFVVQFNQIIQGLFDSLGMHKVGQVVVAIIETVWITIRSFVQVAQVLLDGLGESIASLLEGDFKGAWEALKGIAPEIGQVLTENGDAVKEAFRKIGEDAKDAESEVTSAISEMNTGASSEMSQMQANWSNSWSSIASDTSAYTSGILGTVAGWAQSIGAWVSNALGQIRSLSQAITGVGAMAPTGTVGSAIFSGIFGFADGGIPSTGSLFWAGEAGPELVGQIGGRTTVTNTDMFGQALDGQTNALLGAMNILNKTVQDKSTDISLDGMSLARGMYQYNKRVSAQHGKSMVEVGW